MIINSILPTTQSIRTEIALMLSKFIVIKLRNILMKLFSSVIVVITKLTLSTFNYHTLNIFYFSYFLFFFLDFLSITKLTSRKVWFNRLFQDALFSLTKDCLLNVKENIFKFLLHAHIVCLCHTIKAKKTFLSFVLKTFPFFARYESFSYIGFFVVLPPVRVVIEYARAPRIRLFDKNIQLIFMIETSRNFNVGLYATVDTYKNSWFLKDSFRSMWNVNEYISLCKKSDFSFLLFQLRVKRKWFFPSLLFSSPSYNSLLRCCGVLEGYK